MNNQSPPAQASDEPKVKERPILFSGPMVRALLDGSKTQTRRIVKPQPFREDYMAEENVRRHFATLGPYGQPGDRLWVRESYADIGPRLAYRADQDDGAHCKVTKWTPSIHMFRADSRILLEIVWVRVERLNDCSAADAVAEGIRRVGPGFERWHPDPADVDHTGSTQDPVLAYRGLWESINGAGSWAANPWVWVVEFKRVAT
jgi:hypothetical protein